MEKLSRVRGAIFRVVIQRSNRIGIASTQELKLCVCRHRDFVESAALKLCRPSPTTHDSDPTSVLHKCKNCQPTTSSFDRSARRFQERSFRPKGHKLDKSHVWHMSRQIIPQFSCRYLEREELRRGNSRTMYCYRHIAQKY